MEIQKANAINIPQIKEENHSQWRNQSLTTAGLQNKTKKNWRASMINLMTLIAAVFVFIYVGIEVPLIAPVVEPFCAIYLRILVVSYGLALAAIYIALWLRVYWSFYSNKVLTKVVSKVAKVVNWITLAFLCFLVIGNSVTFLTIPPYVTTPKGCTAMNSNSETDKIKWIFLAACTTTFQVLLLYTFIYPLYVQRRKRLERGFDTKSTMLVVKRAAITAAVCVLSDIFASIFAIFYDGPTVDLYHISCSFNLLVNLFGLVLSTVDWREKVMPWRHSVSNQANGQT
ncbi:unnamed protein product [Clavelina lepadiformis]|uniref:G-protein coupled receptors family 1 profile domain-containing protein n=1 Tax=Clavelina lepadiformis TaxID=159417 RepID=A0ABP0FT02_CLALP